MRSDTAISRLDWVQKYNFAGFGTVPSVYKNDSARAVPIQKNWQFIKADPFVDTAVYQKYPQFDVILPDWCFIIDVDPRHFGPAGDDWKRLKEDFGLADIIKQTFIVKTKSGGYHIHLKKPESLGVKKTLAGYLGIEFLNLKVTGASSTGTRADGSSFLYTPESGEITGIEEAPLTLLEAIERSKRDASGADSGAADLEADIAAYSNYLKSAAPAIEGQTGDTHTFRVAVRGKEYGLSPEITWKLLKRYWNPRCDPPWDEDTLREKVENAWRYTYGNQGRDSIGNMLTVIEDQNPGADTPPEKIIDSENFKDHIPYKVGWDHVGGDATKPLKSTFRNFVNFMRTITELRGAFVKNAFSGQIELVRQLPWARQRSTDVLELREEDLLHLRMLFASSPYNLDFSDTNIAQGVALLAHTKSYHPIRSYLETLKWDGTKRLDTMLIRHMSAEDSRYTRAVTRKTFIGAVARIYQPGGKWDYTLVLEGVEGLGKSSLIRIMGEPWYKEFHIDPRNKETVEMMRGCWLIEMGEMVATRNADSRALMAFLTRQIDRMRLPYAKASEDFPRQSLFIGTNNPDQLGYLDPNSENRRYWVLEVFSKLDQDALRVEKDQLWAEAVHWYHQKEKLYLSDELELTARAIAKNRTPEDPWFDPVSKWVADNYRKGERLTVQMLMEVLLQLPLSKARRVDQVRVEAILMTLGFERKKDRDKGYRYFKIPDTGARTPGKEKTQEVWDD